jgi:DNA-directed RNA polymerase subunit RPC12/RpoP
MISDMQILVQCALCSYSFYLDADWVDKRVSCPQCKRLLKVPSAAELSKPLTILKNIGSHAYIDKDGRMFG